MKTLEDLFKKYPKIFTEETINSHVPPSWIQTIDWLCNSIQGHINNINENNTHLSPVPQLICDQIKDKFGRLRFYYHGGDDKCEGMIILAETILLDTCEYCGSHENVKMENNRYWLRRVCEKCYNETEKKK